MKKYTVGDVVMVPVTVLEVHEQGFPSGLDKHGRPVDPTEPELPAQIIASTPEGVSFDALGRAHFKATAEI